MKTLYGKLLQYLVSISSGFLLAFETAISFFVPCFLITFLDILSAYFLARRVHKKHPELSDGKFKSEYKFRVMTTMLFILILIIIANYVDVNIIKDADLTVRWVVGAFLVYQAWSILENWSSENTNKLARALQRIMVNKIERHLNVPLEDILMEDNETKNTNDDTKQKL